MMSGGIRAVRIVISYPRSPIIPNDQLTPMSTTIIDINVALKLLKKKKKMSAVTPNAAMTNSIISRFKVSAFRVFM